MGSLGARGREWRDGTREKKGAGDGGDWVGLKVP